MTERQISVRRVCDDGGHVLLTPKGSSVSNPGPTILDSTGNLVWTTDQYPNAMNLKLQSYNNQTYLTFWSGTKTGGQGQGLSLPILHRLAVQILQKTQVLFVEYTRETRSIETQF
jgi:hypothetical protein